MAKAPPHPDLVSRLSAFIAAQGGRKAEAARSLGFERHDIQRFLNRNGKMLEFNRVKLEAALDRCEARNAALKELQEIQEIRLMKSDERLGKIAIAVSRFIADAVERQIGRSASSGESK